MVGAGKVGEEINLSVVWSCAGRLGV